ncbi:CinA family protein [Bosea sp. MMO-172]|uniref:CinA family protein n=1 Tax=Bosea sp. MMO-172 TaxID=3127885 RepID=UPI003016FACD
MSESTSIDREDLSRLESAEKLAERLVSLCLTHNERIVTAESCTAGLLGQTLSCCFGAATAFEGGFLTYTKEAKTKMLGVPTDLLKTSTAVHERVALAMAEGALAQSPATIALSITGVTGDAPDDDGNPVGRVVVGCATATESRAVHCEFGNLASPALNMLAVSAALVLALRHLGDETSAGPSSSAFLQRR